MKRNFVTIFAIALWAVSEEITLLPHYAIAQEVRRERAIASFISQPKPGWTQASSPVIAEQSQTAGDGTPDNQRTPGGPRTGHTTAEPIGACKQTDKPLTALVPEKGNQGLTTAEHPIFWFYIPDAPEDIQSIEFSLHDGNDTDTFYRTPIQLTKTPGVIGIPLPPSPKSSLKENQTYRWKLIVNCTAQPKPQDVIALEGLVTRVQPSPNLHGVIWYDELTNRAKRYLSNPQNPEVKKAWAELLKSVGLEGIAQAPLVGSVSNPKTD